MLLKPSHGESLLSWYRSTCLLSRLQDYCPEADAQGEGDHGPSSLLPPDHGLLYGCRDPVFLVPQLGTQHTSSPKSSGDSDVMLWVMNMDLWSCAVMIRLILGATWVLAIIAVGTTSAT